MKRILPFFCLLLCAFAGQAQSGLHHAAQKLKPSKAYDNIHVERLAGDHGASVFVVWIKESVRLHKHASHSETVYVLKGKGQMKLGDKMLNVRKGDVIFIPEGTPHAVTVQGSPMKVISVQAPEFDGSDRVFLDE